MSRRKPPFIVPGDVPEEVWHVEPMKFKGRNRPKVSKAVRAKIYHRDKGQCRRCGSTEDLTIDHVRPLSKGGRNVMANMQTLCWRCNHEKGNKTEAPHRRRK